ncbi:hypothetical protein [Actinocrinis sp.]|jgi:hypothetical protein|uniref:hypothetical protein n=1 Tax=Actinocrinis sp. TaxID=1920516 RepID=UPI002DDD6C09|nr:hypothetical protein [Actinocrinis sp.]
MTGRSRSGRPSEKTALTGAVESGSPLRLVPTTFDSGSTEVPASGYSLICPRRDQFAVRVCAMVLVDAAGAVPAAASDSFAGDWAASVPAPVAAVTDFALADAAADPASVAVAADPTLVAGIAASIPVGVAADPVPTAAVPVWDSVVATVDPASAVVVAAPMFVVAAVAAGAAMPTSAPAPSIPSAIARRAPDRDSAPSSAAAARLILVA